MMADTKFTTGPWQWVGDDEIEQVEHPFTSVAEVVRIHKDHDGTERNANARLIAAAPALYAVADEFLSSLEMLERHGPDLTADGEEFVNAVTLTDRAEMMRAALKQARGEL